MEKCSVAARQDFTNRCLADMCKNVYYSILFPKTGYSCLNQGETDNLSFSISLYCTYSSYYDRKQAEITRNK